MQKKVIILKGNSILSPYRLEKINRSLLEQKNKVISVSNVFVIDINNQVEIELDKLKKLLDVKNNLEVNHNNLFIGPRIGSISPWSSKATDIVNNCGFKSINRIEQVHCYTFSSKVTQEEVPHLYDRMMEMVYTNVEELELLFEEHKPKQDENLSIINTPENLTIIDKKLGLALSTQEKKYLIESYKLIEKEPTSTELMMFAQANSEHCRHKIFNADWIIEGIKQEKSLFSMIRNTEQKTTKPAISAYKDNSAVFSGGESSRWNISDNRIYEESQKVTDILIKVETHNHPTAISPFPGAATGSGGEIRDEAATGQGSRPKAGLTGYSVSHLQIPGHIQEWELKTIGKPNRIASSLEIMIEAPLGGAAFNNEFGRPNICGYFRSMEIETPDFGWRGYHKPIMLAGGMGTINRELAIKQDTQDGDYLIVLGGPAMLIGLGGGAASSMTSGSSCEDLDFASVQRENPEMQRRCQEVIDACWTKSKDSPIRSIHDVGAGGLSNAMPELLDDAGLGGMLEIRNLQIDSKDMSPMEIWCNESQERYVISIKPEKLHIFEKICQRERCPYAVLGQATTKKHLILNDSHFNNKPVDIPMNLLFGSTPKTKKQIERMRPDLCPFNRKGISIYEAVEKILKFPTVASKRYLITIADRTVSGLVHRDQMVGPWQVPVSDCGVTLRDFKSDSGEAMAIGEKAPLALISGASSARMAVCEALTNIVANDIGDLSNIKLSANWMAASGHGREDEILFDAVKAIGEELCPALGIGIPVGKDSLSMNTQWNDGLDKQVKAPVSLIISAFANIKDINKSITPYFDRNEKQHVFYVDLANGQKRLGGSSLLQVYQQLGNVSPDLESVDIIKSFWEMMQNSISNDLISAYHDISDGGLFVSVLEMCIASQCGMKVKLDFSKQNTLDVMFSEELGAVITVSDQKLEQFKAAIKGLEINDHTHLVAITNKSSDKLEFIHHKDSVFKQDLKSLQIQWEQTSHWMASLRDNPKTSNEEFLTIGRDKNGLTPKVDFEFDNSVIAPYVNLEKPKVAILREQGVNGQKEMAMAFHLSGFECHDIHMQDILDGKINLMEYQGITACGGFSYGDVLGAGKGWANSILFHENIKQQFAEYFNDNNRFALGVCNGCQMLSSLKEIIPGTEKWPKFLRNESEKFEARFSSLHIEESQAMFFDGMQGAQIPVAISHGEGRAVFKDKMNANIAASYVNNDGLKTQEYPYNPNGSDFSAAAITNDNGNVLIMMPHPERVFRSAQMSWSPKAWKNNSPWMRMFYNARKFV
ncbi:MAG: phosphoribosylformylglycinamidine synthase [Marinicellaceae bacterium]